MTPKPKTLVFEYHPATRRQCEREAILARPTLAAYSCPHCREMVLVDAEVCWNCGANLKKI